MLSNSKNSETSQDAVRLIVGRSEYLIEKYLPQLQDAYKKYSKKMSTAATVISEDYLSDVQSRFSQLLENNLVPKAFTLEDLCFAAERVRDACIVQSQDPAVLEKQLEQNEFIFITENLIRFLLVPYCDLGGLNRVHIFKLFENTINLPLNVAMSEAFSLGTEYMGSSVLIVNFPHPSGNELLENSMTSLKATILLRHGNRVKIYTPSVYLLKDSIRLSYEEFVRTQSTVFPNVSFVLESGEEIQILESHALKACDSINRPELKKNKRALLGGQEFTLPNKIKVEDLARLIDSISTWTERARSRNPGTIKMFHSDPSVDYVRFYSYLPELVKAIAKESCPGFLVEFNKKYPVVHYGVSVADYHRV